MTSGRGARGGKEEPVTVNENEGGVAGGGQSTRWNGEEGGVGEGK